MERELAEMTEETPAKDAPLEEETKESSPEVADPAPG
jgi:hypothetical protein